MFRCLGRLVAFALLLVLGVAAYLTRDRWMPTLASRIGWHRAATAVAWEPITPGGARRARAALDTLGRPTGPGFVNVAPADLVAFALEPVLSKMTSVSGNPDDRLAARADSGTIAIRGGIRMADLGGAAWLGPLGGAADGIQRIEVRGRIDVPAAGKPRFTVTRIIIGDLTLPSAAIGRATGLLAPSRGNDAPPGEVAIPLPRQVGDVRLLPGRVTLYKGPQ